MVEVVFVVADGIAHMREVEIGISDDNYYEVRSGLEEGETVVTGPFTALSRILEDGDAVKVKPSSGEISRD
jgi:HlyD family secretion protein